MTTFNLDENHAAYQIKAFKPGMIQVNDIILNKSIIISPSQLIDNWEPQSVNELSAQSFAMILEMKPDILLIGTGSQAALLPIELYGELLNYGIGVEIMTTSAACRTYTALSSENRNVVAALIVS